MDWTRQIDGYCERLGPGLWAEPVNAVTNLAFLLVALVMWRRVRGRELPLAGALCAVLAGIGIASGLFHTHAVAWAGMLDSLAILVFVLLYLYAANRAFLGLGRGMALAGTALFLPFAAATVPLFLRIPGLGASAAYLPVPLLIGLYAFWLRGRAPQTARGLAIGTGLLLVSLGFRSLDGPLCAALPIGTHALWHLVNAAMLGWMIEVYRAHVLASRAGADLQGARRGGKRPLMDERTTHVD